MEFSIYGQTLGIFKLEYCNQKRKGKTVLMYQKIFLPSFLNLGHGVSGSALRHMPVM